MHPRISSVTLGVEDLEDSAAFYRDGPGWLEEGTEGDGTFFETAGQSLALYPWDVLAKNATVPLGGGGFRGLTLANDVEPKAAVDGALDEAGAAGAEIVEPAGETDWDDYLDYFADPDGFLWEVAWNPGSEIDP